MVSTGLGMGLGLDAHLAPTSTRWQRVFVQGDKTAVISGTSLDHAIALRTDDGGRSWVALKTAATERSVGHWAVADDGAVVLAMGQRAKGQAQGGQGLGSSLQLFFAEPRDTELSGPVPLFPKGGAPEGATADVDRAFPAAWSGPMAGMLVSVGRRNPAMAYGAPAGRQLPKPVGPLPAETFVTAPYGRPPALLSVRGSQLSVRPWPKPGEKLEPATPVPGFAAASSAHDQLSQGPTCESGPWSFRLVKASPQASLLVGISPNRALAVKVALKDARLIGCSPEAIVIQTPDAKTQNPQLVRCSLDGQCAKPQSPPFRYWTEKHDRSIHATATAKGVVATMAARTGARWGLYLGQSLDEGKLFELPRVIGEGSSDRGYLELGAIVNWPQRVLLLLSADVTGTSRRGWYVIASDDGGTNWGPP